jgi:IPT/TIG domain-containing protein
MRVSHVVVIAVAGLMAGTLTLVNPTLTWSVTPEKPAEKPAQKDKPAKKPKAQSVQKGRVSEGATKASGADKVSKATACFGVTPKIDHVTPDEVTIGDTITITGKDFGSAGCLSSISFGPGNQAKFEQKDESVVTATVPAIKKKGIVLLTVTTASGEDSKAVFVK